MRASLRLTCLQNDMHLLVVSWHAFGFQKWSFKLHRHFMAHFLDVVVDSYSQT